ncbi:hypothetical protein L226DRAFT_542401 [Lentinus tigrinus ALCF2SS1-7]|uniref:Cyclin N-terminal domain-containing protein n=1 Tax=Lentinus tigrinus ALCF2SS1-6 TaxID=1328759 RepID=A0A5C2SWK8_9APHY|nr:hypothetical protein L227DRAFT_582596 [Lentinus tigrinus ALCF2SS1-6]RPD81209.1 hypothetical protein L226DRAFT_542401 [Lentinus tigrinus ALCF2SS1-7]
MPVPVPVYTKQPAHPVIKINHPSQPDSKSSLFQHLTHSLPLPPQGPPPSFATREEWISSLPSWRRNKPRRIWEDDSASTDRTYQGFNEGLTAAEDAPVIKGQLAQARIPPVRATHVDPQSYVDMYLPQEELDDEMCAYPAAMRDWQSEDGTYVADLSPTEQKHYERMAEDSPTDSDVAMGYPAFTRPITRSYSAPDATQVYASYEKGAFSPVLEDYSPQVPDDLSPEPAAGAEPGSSPVGPATPFAEFVDNAFAEAQFAPAMQRSRDVEVSQAPPVYATHDGYHGSCYQCQTYQVEQPVQQAPVADSVVTPVATAAYKKLAAPLSEWMVNFVWKVCTTGKCLSPEYAQPSAFAKHYPSSPPSHLVASTHSMLLSTLLQPSAIFLALWYIVRLPVFFSPVSLGPEHAKEMRFRAELLGEPHLGTDREIIEAYAPFRLILLGCMLANKWLDDHTFSNKTWHTISNVPIRSLNRLESLALDIFQYDLNISPQQWAGWLSEVMAYHQGLSSPMFPQPISRPSSSPQVIVRQAIETLINARPVECGCEGTDAQTCTVPPQPVFVGLEERSKEKVEYVETSADDVLEIDLDEDGPLREEYLPRRRVSSRVYNFNAEPYAKAPEHTLPPPAKWSPAADEPIVRGQLRGHGQYVAPQPVSHLSMAPPPPPPPYQPAGMDMHRTSWPVGGYMPRQEAIQRPPVFVPPPVYQAPVPGFEYGYAMTGGHHGHARSHSLSYSQAIAEQVPGRVRSYSQSQFDHPYSDVRGTEAQYAAPPPVASHWVGYDRIGFPTSYDRPYGLHRPSLKA